MNDTLQFILQRHNVDINQPSPILLNMSRLKELPKIFRKVGFKVGAEIGVSKGYYSKILCQYIPGLKLYCIDPWLAYDEYVEQHDTNGQIILNDCYEVAKQKLNSYNCEFIKEFSMNAVKNFEDNSLDFVFIDGNHSFQYVINDIAEWNKKVRVGGIISGHDYWRSFEGGAYIKGLSPEEKIQLCQVKDAVLGWTYANQIKPWFVTVGDKCPSWFWVK